MDRTSSPTTVYLRRNIAQVDKATGSTGDGEEQTVSMWEYEEKEMTVEEYESMLLMQQVVTENTQEIVSSVTEFQKASVIDEYTAQLIEEGLI